MTNLESIAKEIRKLIVKTVYENKAGHLGGPLSAADILTYLYFEQMNINSKMPFYENRDRFILSKGHASIALYATLAMRGYFPLEELSTFDKINSRLQAHPDMSLLPGIDFSTGSLGQGISGAVGIALAAKKLGKNFKVYCMVGDGESQEGQFWEAIDIAAKYKLNNLIVILDNNGLQQYGFKDNMYKTPIIDPFHKLDSFYWDVININGHNFFELLNAFSNAKLSKNYPMLINARTIKGKGISFMENKQEWHSRIPTEEEYKLAMEELK